MDVTKPPKYNPRVKKNLHDMSLDDYIQFQLHEQSIQDILSEDEEAKVFLEIGEIQDEELYELAMTERSIRRYDLIMEQLKLIVEPEDAFMLPHLSRIELYEKKSMAKMEYTDYKKGTVVHIPDANSEQIKDLERYLTEFVPLKDIQERGRIKLQIARLQKNEFILLPVQDAIFGVKVQTDNIRKKLSKLPEEIAEAQVEYTDPAEKNKLNLMLTKLEDEIAGGGARYTNDEMREKLGLRKMIKRYQTQVETDVVINSAEILTHLLVPVDESYSSKYAEARLPYVKKLTMDKVLPFINFISAVLQS